jgi:hypothetical protein
MRRATVALPYTACRHVIQSHHRRKITAVRICPTSACFAVWSCPLSVFPRVCFRRTSKQTSTSDLKLSCAAWAPVRNIGAFMLKAIYVDTNQRDSCTTFHSVMIVLHCAALEPWYDRKPRHAACLRRETLYYYDMSGQPHCSHSSPRHQRTYDAERLQYPRAASAGSN